MALSPKLELRQGQSLVMTPQLQQAIRLLQLSHLDLSAYVEAELERNPLLERDESGDGAANVDAESVQAGDGDGGDGDAGESLWTQSPGEVAAGLDTDVENVFPDDTAADGISAGAPGNRQDGPRQDGGWASAHISSGGFDSDGYDLEAMLTRAPTLHEHLAEQLALSFADPVKRLIGQHIIDLTDSAGYLAGETGALADQLGCEAALVEETLAAMQGFDPPGVFARGLAECLALQLRDKDRYDPAMQALIANIELLARRDFAAIKRLCGVDDEDLAGMIAEIRELDPKPGLRFSTEVAQPVVPDVFVRAAADGGWAVELNSDTLPKVLVNQSYYARIAGRAQAADKTYLSDCLADANWLVKSLDQRARTILKVSSEIVRQQDAFLVHGVQHLRPLNLRTVADAIAMHESTVSRVTSNKYMATPRGIFELKYFFTSSIAAADGGDAHSAEAVRHRIKGLIDQETPDGVLSDDQLVQALRSDGIDIARRTVAKYREAMRIPSSVQRRREKRQFA